MALFSKEKDIFLKIVNSVLVLVLIFTVVIAFATGIKIINKEDVKDYKTYSNEVCALNELEYECTDKACIKDIDKERKDNCTESYIKAKKEAKKMNKSNRDNFLISISTSVILALCLRILNKKSK